MVDRTTRDLEMEEFRYRLLVNGDTKLRESFSSIKIFHLSESNRSNLARYANLKNNLMRDAREIQAMKHDASFSFSALHQARLYSHSVRHFAQSYSEVFDVVTVSRESNKVTPDMAEHIGCFLGEAIRTKMPHDSVTSFVASAILMDAYPPGRHRKSLPPSCCQAY